MIGEQDTRKPWELDPNERGMSDPNDITDHLERVARCKRTCRDLGTSAYYCAFEGTFPSLQFHTLRMQMCEDIKVAGGTQPRHGLKSIEQ